MNLNQSPRNDRPDGKMPPWSLWQGKYDFSTGERVLISYTNPDGHSVTVTPGTALEVTTREDGSRSVILRNPDGTMTRLARYDVMGNELE